MRRIELNDGWEYQTTVNAFSESNGPREAPVAVTLPHDATIGLERAPHHGSAGAYFPDGAFSYARTLDGAMWRTGERVEIEFESVYRGARVYVNDAYAGGWEYGYSEFAVRIDPLLRPGATNTLRVECHNHADSRWYAGAGIIRPVHLLAGGPVHIPRNGIRVTTPHVDADGALVCTEVTVANHDAVTRSIRVEVQIATDEGEVVAIDGRPLTITPASTETIMSRVHVPQPRRWSADEPSLYSATVRLTDGAEAEPGSASEVPHDEERVTFGIRTLLLDTHHGLRVNGVSVKLRGACIHHDNGALGAASVARADERRIELLRDAGFNAIRSSHQPVSRAILDACDRLGMYVMDEFADMWHESKAADDYATVFDDWWQRDLDAMVLKDRNHPSVIMYSIGNEIPESSRAIEQRWGRLLANRVRELDPTRYVTAGVNGAQAVMAQSTAIETARAELESGTLGINTFMNRFQALIDEQVVSEQVGQATEEVFAYLDVAGYNYMPSRYPIDGDRFPHRVIVGTEAHPPKIHEYWSKVEALPHVIGDFTWTGWDYLGEVGIGRVDYPAPGGGPSPFMGAFPWLTAWTGDLTISGVRRPISYHREIVYRLRSDPAIAVCRPEHHGKAAHQGLWAWSDSVDSWSWHGYEGKPVTVEVSARADEVELYVNGESVGRTAPVACLATFETNYVPGVVQAIAYRNGVAVGRSELRTASGSPHLSARADRDQITSGSHDLAYLSIALADEQETIFTTATADVRVAVTGPGVLAGLQSDDPQSPEAFTSDQRRTFAGRALAIIRPTGQGTISATVSSEGFAPTTTLIRVD